jgi:hypothetical protein
LNFNGVYLNGTLNDEEEIYMQEPALPSRRIRSQQITARQTLRSASLSPSEPQKRRVPSGMDRTDPLARIRRAALDVFTVLRELKESARVPRV